MSKNNAPDCLRTVAFKAFPETVRFLTKRRGPVADSVLLKGYPDFFVGTLMGIETARYQNRYESSFLFTAKPPSVRSDSAGN